MCEACKDFCTWLFSSRNKGYTCIAHNSKAFDGQFILKYLVQNGVKPVVIYSESKIQYLEVTYRSIRFVDSLNHLPMPLAALPISFGLEALKKGYFPYFANTERYQNFVGPVLDPKLYSDEFMKPEARADFLKWHAEQKDKIFDSQRDMHHYCVSDVDILRRCCLKYRKLVMGLCNGIDPFRSISCAQMCFALYRHMFLFVSKHL